MFQKAALLNAGCAEIYNNMGNTLHDQRKLDEAISSFKKAISFKPDYAEAYYNMGIVLKDNGSFKEAIEAYEMQYHLNKNFPDILLQHRQRISRTRKA